MALDVVCDAESYDDIIIDGERLLKTLYNCNILNIYDGTFTEYKYKRKWIIKDAQIGYVVSNGDLHVLTYKHNGDDPGKFTRHTNIKCNIEFSPYVINFIANIDFVSEHVCGVRQEVDREIKSVKRIVSEYIKMQESQVTEDQISSPPSYESVPKVSFIFPSGA